VLVTCQTIIIPLRWLVLAKQYRLAQ